MVNPRKSRSIAGIDKRCDIGGRLHLHRDRPCAAGKRSLPVLTQPAALHWQTALASGTRRGLSRYAAFASAPLMTRIWP